MANNGQYTVTGQLRDGDDDADDADDVDGGVGDDGGHVDDNGGINKLRSWLLTEFSLNDIKTWGVSNEGRVNHQVL